MYLTAEAAAKLLDVTADTMREWARRKIVPAVKLGKEWRFIQEQLEQHIASKAEENVCRSTNVPRRHIGGADSRSVIERFAKAQGPTTGKKPKSSRPDFVVVTGGKAS